jgi:hypothetical protein
MRTYCTYFDSRFLAQGIVMLRSLRQFDPDSFIRVLAFDDTCARILGDVFGSSILIAKIAEFHSENPDLAALRSSRTAWAFYATHKPAFVGRVLAAEPSPDSVTFIDADMLFFADPSPAYAEIGTAEIALSPHRFPASNQRLAVYGTFNAGWIYWRAGAPARQCLADWERDCVEWCESEVQPDGRFMNQGYLTRWPEKYPGVHIVRHPGVNLAPWNLDGHRLEGNTGEIRSDGCPLICFHFSGLLREASGEWFSTYPCPRQFELVRKALYQPYLDEVESESLRLQDLYGVEGPGSVRSLTIDPGYVRVYAAQR